MKKMLALDFINMRKYLLQLVVGMSAMIILIPFLMGVDLSSTAIIFMGVILPFGPLILLMTVDGKNKWDLYRITLPIKRSDVVFGRYLTVILLTLVGVVLGLVLTLLMAAIVPMLGPSAGKMGFDLSTGEDLLVVSLVPFCIVFFIFSIMLPLVFKFGMTKTIQWIPLVLIALFVVSSVILGSQDPALLEQVTRFFQEDSNRLIVQAGAVGATGLLFLLSMGVSLKIYRKKSW